MIKYRVVAEWHPLESAMAHEPIERSSWEWMSWESLLELLREHLWWMVASGRNKVWVERRR
jgi:hypothetical protein